ncbi:glycerophosphodiester phosphodiesterase [Hymenobacter sp. HMF4947]|uniref:Glycerophosphodiester phosphodiesterase n=1 Tax=Hymenobacter ginkgonis TaxID=2682976 RepID=A0A7K1TCV7_9BACT|nr:glycerophosphodiester phosphodiesterase family protein [Hymenobacter ginkgonis]MVN76244.1 glycerophosphodiester phosphodiesterase [Hymenobacter ginkgonis]
MAFPTPPYRPEVHGHRGCRGLFPENTLPAFLHALSLGVDVLELDVVVSADHQVVVSHEPWLSARLGTGPHGEEIDPAHERSFNLYQLPYTTIRRCVVGDKPHPDFPSQQLIASYRPLLNEVIQVVENACQQLGRLPISYSIEVKSEPASDGVFHPSPIPFVELVLAEIYATAILPRTTLLSFDARILQAARLQAPALKLCLLVESDEPFAELLRNLGFVPDALGPAFELLSVEKLRALHTAYPTLRIVPWTVNELLDMTCTIEWGVAGITTDYPDRLLSLLYLMTA